jgi:catechol 2,3-dioxygenase-like lactoylglutathione lyase family enzyme
LPNLENLKKQAKLILRWHREGRLPVAERIRNGLSRFASLSDTDILARPFQLADAQELVAHESGFDSWKAARTGTETMSTESTENPSAAAKPNLVVAMPQVFADNIDASAAFYAEKLGFEIAFTFGSPAFYAIVERDGAVLNLRRIDTPVFDPSARQRNDVLAANIVVDNVKPLFLEFQDRGVAFRQPLRRQPWGAQDFVVEDPDGNLLLFASRNNEP